MKFDIGDLVCFVRTDFTYKQNKIIIPKFNDYRRGNCAGLIVEINSPEFDSRLYYTYRVVYQNGFSSWEVEDDLRCYINYIKHFPTLFNNLKEIS